MFSFSGLTSALRGEPSKDDGGGSPQDGASASTASPKSAAAGLWGFASTLTETVKQTTADLAASIHDTDWASELASLKQGLGDESAALAHSAKAAAERLPVLAERLPEKTGAALQSHKRSAAGQLSGTLSALREEVHMGIREGISAVLGSGVSDTAAAAPATGSGGAGAGPHSAAVAPAALLEDPSGSPQFQAWLGEGRMEARRSAAQASDPGLAGLLASLVPGRLSEEAFWQRYLYARYCAEERRRALRELTQRSRRVEEVDWDCEDEEEEEDEAVAGGPGEVGPPAAGAGAASPGAAGKGLAQGTAPGAGDEARAAALGRKSVTESLGAGEPVAALAVPCASGAAAEGSSVADGVPSRDQPAVGGSACPGEEVGSVAQARVLLAEPGAVSAAAAASTGPGEGTAGRSAEGEPESEEVAAPTAAVAACGGGPSSPDGADTAPDPAGREQALADALLASPGPLPASPGSSGRAGEDAASTASRHGPSTSWSVISEGPSGESTPLGPPLAPAVGKASKAASDDDWGDDWE
ncbi:hypothetical protein ACKKBG_A35545 [Auxenochlorella protothecoides x Auxenochlorella symbiontica]